MAQNVDGGRVATSTMIQTKNDSLSALLTLSRLDWMSAKGHKRTLSNLFVTSALPPKADMAARANSPEPTSIKPTVAASQLSHCRHSRTAKHLFAILVGQRR